MISALVVSAGLSIVLAGAGAGMISALVVSAWLSIVMAGVDGGRLAYHMRTEGGLTAAPWLEWANHVVDLPAAFPAFVPQPVQPDPGGLVSRANATRTGLLAILPWIVCLAGAAAIVIRLGRTRVAGCVEPQVALTACSFATAATLAIAINWGW